MEFSSPVAHRNHHHQPRPLNLVDRFAFLFISSIGSTIAYNALPKGLKPMSLIILGVGLWHAGGCSYARIQELAQALFKVSSHRRGSQPTYDTPDNDWGSSSPPRYEDENFGSSYIPPNPSSHVNGDWGRHWGSNSSRRIDDQDKAPTHSVLPYYQHAEKKAGKRS